MAQEKKAIIVGGGLVGTLWAIFLARRGYTVDVYESRGDMRQVGYIGGRSINLAMSERGWRAVRQAGIEEAIRKVAIPMEGRMIHNLNGELVFQPYGEQGQAIYSVSRGGLNMELLKIADEFDKVRFHFNHRCLKVDADRNTLLFEDTKTGARMEESAPLIFGTDGAFSAVRNSLQKRSRFNYSQSYLDYAYKELCILPGPDGKHVMDTHALHIWPRGNFMLIALPNTDGTFTCTLFLPFEGVHAFEHLQGDEAVMAFFKEHFPDAIPLMPGLLEDFRINPTSSLATIRCSPWHVGEGVLLLGDAAHAIVPFFGQGMNAGFEDCTILDQMIDEYEENWQQILPEFSRSRPKDANAIADLALANFIEMRDLVADPVFLLRKKIAALLHEKFGDEFLPMYSMVSFGHVPYSQALAEGQRQDQLLDSIIQIEGIEHNWANNPAVLDLYHQWKKK